MDPKVHAWVKGEFMSKNTEDDSSYAHIPEQQFQAPQTPNFKNILLWSIKYC